MTDFAFELFTISRRGGTRFIRCLTIIWGDREASLFSLYLYQCECCDELGRIEADLLWLGLFL